LRASLLEHDPQTGPVTIETLVGVANAIEQEAVRRYAQLERTMQQRGEFETASAFRRMLEEEREHVGAVARWAAELGVAIPDSEPFEWILPRDLSTSWDAIAGSALLTPYRAFAIAVENEQRAFAFYAYLAAHAGEIQSRETLYQRLYRREYNGLDRTLDVRISQLRKKLGDTGNPEKIKTVWGHGYLFVPEAW